MNTSGSEDELDEECKQLVEEHETMISTKIETYQQLLLRANN
ncbi:hypothetical protein ACD661_00050 [Legionella lytica]|uniref:Uncharacterized protein n=1 Tax=Legionella lytica TaxID=96232 RepID=A0ABW8D6C7_9GAMM